MKKNLPHEVYKYPLAVNKLKLFIYIIFFGLISKSALCQSRKSIDSLIRLLDNKQLRGECHFIWEVHMISEAGWTLQRMGEKVYPYLTSCLTDTTRGIIVHFIMQAISSNINLGIVNFEFDEKSETFITDLHDFKIYKNKQRPYYFARAEDLEENKKKWIDRIKVTCR